MQKLSSTFIRPFMAAHGTTAKTLDIGAGTGPYRAYFPNCTTLDLDPEKHPDVVGRAEALPFADASFEAVVCTAVIQYVSSPEVAMREMYRVLTPGGALLFSALFAAAVSDGAVDKWRFTRSGVESLLAGFEEVRIEAVSGPFSTLGICLDRLVLLSSVRGGRPMKLVLRLIARGLTHLDWLVTKSWGNLEKSYAVPETITYGYNVTARKPKGESRSRAAQ